MGSDLESNSPVHCDGCVQASVGINRGTQIPHAPGVPDSGRPRLRAIKPPHERADGRHKLIAKQIKTLRKGDRWQRPRRHQVVDEVWLLRILEVTPPTD